MKLIDWLLNQKSPGPIPPAPVAESPQNSGTEAVPATTNEADRILLSFGDTNHNTYTIGQSFNGCVIFGATGSGKTSGSGAALARAFLSTGYGALVLCVKAEEADLWRRYAAETGRQNDLIFFGSDPRWRFNFLDYEARRPGVGAGLTENLIQLFVEVSSIGEGEAIGGKGDDPFWERAMRSLIRNLLDTLMLAKKPITLPAMFEVLRSAPQDAATASSASWATDSLCAQMLAAANEATVNTPARSDYEQTAAYWLREFPTMPDKTRGSVVEMFRTMAESLMRGTMRTLFCEGKSNVIPEHTLTGKILIIDLPVKQWGGVGRYAGVMWKYCWQKAIERRRDNADGHGRPVALWADEFQFFSTKNDYLYQTTARSSRAATVYLTQTMSGLIAALGGEINGKSRVDALLANLDTKIFHANSDRDTNHWASELLGRDRLQFHSRSMNYSPFSKGGPSYGSSVSEQMEFRVQAVIFTELKKGGPTNKKIVQAIVFQTGRTWATDAGPRNWVLVEFHQC